MPNWDTLAKMREAKQLDGLIDGTMEARYLDGPWDVAKTWILPNAITSTPFVKRN